MCTMNINIAIDARHRERRDEISLGVSDWVIVFLVWYIVYAPHPVVIGVLASGSTARLMLPLATMDTMLWTTDRITL